MGGEEERGHVRTSRRKKAETSREKMKTWEEKRRVDIQGPAGGRRGRPVGRR